MKKRQNDLGQDPIFSLVLRLAIPTMLAQLVSVLYSIVDRMYIGNIPEIGTTALAGVGVCGPIVTLLSSFATLIGLGGSPIMAMRMGQGQKDMAQRILNTCFLVLIVLSLGLTALFLLTKEHLLLWFGASPETFPYANTYMTIYTAGTFFALMATGMNSFLICQGFSGLGMGTVMLGAALNIVLDPIFIFLLDMDVAGAAIATVLSQMASCVFVLLSLRSRKMPIRLGWGGFRWPIVRKVVVFGISPFIIIATDSVLLIVLNTVLQRYGGPELGDTLVVTVAGARKKALFFGGDKGKKREVTPDWNDDTYRVPLNGIKEEVYSTTAPEFTMYITVNSFPMRRFMTIRNPPRMKASFADGNVVAEVAQGGEYVCRLYRMDKTVEEVPLQAGESSVPVSADVVEAEVAEVHDGRDRASVLVSVRPLPFLWRDETGEYWLYVNRSKRIPLPGDLVSSGKPDAARIRAWHDQIIRMNPELRDVTTQMMQRAFDEMEW